MGRFGNDFREVAVVDPISGRTHTSRVRSESPRGCRRSWDGAFLDNPLYRGRVGLSRAALDAPLYDPLLRRAALDDPLYRRAALDGPLYRRAALDDPLYRRNALADPLYRDPLHRDPLYRDPLYRDPLLCRDPLYRGVADPLYARGLADPLYADPLYRRSALDSDWRLSSRVGAGRDPYFRRSAYDDVTLARRSANLDGALFNREHMYDLDNVTWSRSAFRNPLTGTLA